MVKHPSVPADRRTEADFIGNVQLTPLQVLPLDIMTNLGTVPAGSSGETNGLTTQHLSDLIAGTSDKLLKSNFTDFINIVLHGDLLMEVREIFLEAD